MKRIMFNTPLGLEEAVIDGRKLMTRRALKAPKRFCGVDAPQVEFHRNAKGLYFDCVLLDDNDHEIGQCPLPYEVGDKVAVLQSYERIYSELFKQGTARAAEFYEKLQDAYSTPMPKCLAGWSNKMFVKAEFMPHVIEIADLFFERLQDISDEDCLREGIYAHTVELDETPGIHPYTSYAYNMLKGSNIKRWWFETPRKAFAALIDKLSGKGTWEQNDWQVAYTFNKVQL